MAKLVYKPLGLFFSVLGGILAGALFKRLWRAVAHESDAPKATDRFLTSTRLTRWDESEW